MKRLLDSLLSRWYVRREVHDLWVGIAFRRRIPVVLSDEEWRQVEALRTSRPEIIVSADFQRGLPCS